MDTSKKFDWLTLLAFLGIVLFGGSNAVAVRFSNQGLPRFGVLLFALVQQRSFSGSFS